MPKQKQVTQLTKTQFLQRFFAVIEDLSIGVPLRQALALHQLPRAMWDAELAHNSELAEQAESAKARFVRETLSRFHLAPRADWQRYAWLLERSAPDEFSGKAILKIDQAHVELLLRAGLTPTVVWAALMQKLESELADEPLPALDAGISIDSEQDD